MSFNLPPGCSLNDIPGNREIDVIVDQICDAYEEAEVHPHLEDIAYDVLCGERSIEEAVWYMKEE